MLLLLLRMVLIGLINECLCFVLRVVMHYFRGHFVHLLVIVMLQLLELILPPALLELNPQLPGIPLLPLSLENLIEDRQDHHGQGLLGEVDVKVGDQLGHQLEVIHGGIHPLIGVDGEILHDVHELSPNRPYR